MNCTCSFSGVCNGSRGRTSGVYSPSHAPRGAAARCQRCSRSAPPAPASCPSRDAPGHFICPEASASPKRCCSSDGAMGTPDLRHPTKESRAKGSTAAVPWSSFPGGKDALQAVGWRQSCPHPACPLACSRSIPPAPGASLQRGTAVPVRPAPAWAAWASLAERRAGSCLRLLHPAAPICRGKAVVDNEHNN